MKLTAYPQVRRKMDWYLDTMLLLRLLLQVLLQDYYQ